MSDTKKEIACQHGALKRLSNNNSDIALKFVLWHDSIIAKIFRNLINEFENKYNCCPTVDQLIWLTSEILKTDISKIKFD